MDLLLNIKANKKIRMEAALAKIRRARGLPKDAQVVSAIIRESGCDNYEPRVVNQLLEFTYGYVTRVLLEAKAIANHAKKTNIDLPDVQLASAFIHAKSFVEPPPRDVLVELAKKTNSIPLPPQPVKKAGPRLPLDRHCLLAPNLRLKRPKTTTKPKPNMFKLK